MDEHENELAFLLARAGLRVPAAALAPMQAAYAELQTQTGLLRQQRGPEAEPSNIYSLVPR